MTVREEGTPHKGGVNPGGTAEATAFVPEMGRGLFFLWPVPDGGPARMDADGPAAAAGEETRYREGGIDDRDRWTWAAPRGRHRHGAQAAMAHGPAGAVKQARRSQALWSGTE